MDLYTNNLLHHVSHVPRLQHHSDWSLAVLGQGEQYFRVLRKPLTEASHSGPKSRKAGQNLKNESSIWGILTIRLGRGILGLFNRKRRRGYLLYLRQYFSPKLAFVESGSVV
jgi:hypothetical protein